MASNHNAWGIEVGANAIKAVHLVRNEQGIKLADYEILPFKKILTTPDLNVDEAIQVGLDQLLAKHELKKSQVVISVAGHLAFARFAKLPPVEPRKIPDIVKFEAVQQVPFPLDQVEWDYQVFTQPDSPDVEVGIFAITKERVESTLKNYQAMQIPVHGLTLSPVAVYNAIAYDMDLVDQPEGLIIIDIGTVSTDIIIADGGDLWLRTLQIGGNNFTEALVRAFKLSFPKAEKLKREAATSKYARQIFQAMRPVFSDLVQEVQRSLGYYQSTNRDAKLSKVMGVGSTFRLPGLQKFLKQQLQMDVIRPDGFKKIAAEGTTAADFNDHALNLVTAYGLALQGLGAERIEANILPRQVLRQRLWRAKQPIFAAAAACMVVGVAGAAARWWMDYSAFNSAKATAEQTADPVLRDAAAYASKWARMSQKAEKDTSERIGKIRRVMDYRDIWPKVLEDMSVALLSTQTNPELLKGTYADVKAIPRNQRLQLYIDSITVGYGGAEIIPPVGGVAGAAQAPMAGPQDYMESDYGPPAGYGGPPAGYGGPPPGFGGGPPGFSGAMTNASLSPSFAGTDLTGLVDNPQTPAKAVTEPRYFLIKIVGSSPADRDRAYDVVDKFASWYVNNPTPKNRPYRYTAFKKHFVVNSKLQVTPTAMTPATGMARNLAAKTAALATSQQLDASIGTVLPNPALYPTRPDAEEILDKDSQWEFTFRLDILSSPMTTTGDLSASADQPAAPLAERPAPAQPSTPPTDNASAPVAARLPGEQSAQARPQSTQAGKEILQ